MPRTLVHKGRKIQVYDDVEPGPDGRPIRRDMVIHPGAAAILPLVDRDHVCLLRNPRFILNETLWRCRPAPWNRTSRRRSRRCGSWRRKPATRPSWRKLAEFYPSPGVLSERTHLFVAEGLTAGPMRPEADEQMEPHVVPWDQALAPALDGTIRDAKTLVAPLLWDRLR